MKTLAEQTTARQKLEQAVPSPAVNKHSFLLETMATKLEYVEGQLSGLSIELQQLKQMLAIWRAQLALSVPAGAAKCRCRRCRVPVYYGYQRARLSVQ